LGDDLGLGDLTPCCITIIGKVDRQIRAISRCRRLLLITLRLPSLGGRRGTAHVLRSRRTRDRKASWPRHRGLVDTPSCHWASRPGRGACMKSMAQIISSHRLLKIVAVAYIVQVAVAVVVGFTLPFLQYFGVW